MFATVAWLLLVEVVAGLGSFHRGALFSLGSGLALWLLLSHWLPGQQWLGIRLLVLAVSYGYCVARLTERMHGMRPFTLNLFILSPAPRMVSRRGGRANR